jgi:ATP/maltotriose-dependent transcriptional regulator MalT
MLQQTVVLEQDSSGIPWLILIVNDRSPVQDLTAPLRRQLVHTPSGRLYLFPPEESQTTPPLSVRELEILGMIAQGYVSQEIACSFFSITGYG